MSYFFTNTDEPCEPLTLNRLQEAMDNLRQREHERMVERGQRMLDFWESVPTHLRSHPIVREMAAIVESDQPIHPKRYERIRQQWDRLMSYERFF